MNGKNDLRACPFCGGVDRALSHGFYHGRDLDRIYFVECQCGASVEADSEDDAIAVWNTRSSGWEDGLGELAEILKPFVIAAEHYRSDHDDNEIRIARSYAAGKHDATPYLRARDFRRLAALAKSLPSTGES